MASSAGGAGRNGAGPRPARPAWPGRDLYLQRPPARRQCRRPVCRLRQRCRLGNGASNPAPYIFRCAGPAPGCQAGRLDLRQSPRAEPGDGGDGEQRWGGCGPPNGYTAGAPLDPTMAAYWEVPLRDTSADQLQQFDVLYLHASYNCRRGSAYAASFTPADNEKAAPVRRRRRAVVRRVRGGSDGEQLTPRYWPALRLQLDKSNALFADVQWHDRLPSQ